MPKAHLSGVRGPSAVIRVRDIRKSRWILVLFSGDKEPVGDVPRLQSWLKSFDLIMTLLCNQTDRRGRRSLHFRYTINAAPYAPPCLPLTRGVSRSDEGREPIQCDPVTHHFFTLTSYLLLSQSLRHKCRPLRTPSPPSDIHPTKQVLRGPHYREVSRSDGGRELIQCIADTSMFALQTIHAPLVQFIPKVIHDEVNSLKKDHPIRSGPQH